jgi:putative ABC transport system permease protein
MEGLVFGIGRFDPASLLVTAVVLLLTAAVASYVPARRAAAVNPAVTLREE